MRTESAISTAARPPLSHSLSKNVASAPVALNSSRRSELVFAAYEEYCSRIEDGQTVDIEEYCQRYSSIRSSLCRLINIHNLADEHLVPRSTGPFPQAGDTFAGFHLLEELGRGAFARVFLAEDLALGNRRIVVKISSQGDLEARIQGSLDHPNIVPVNALKADPESGLFALAMPFLGRATLHDIKDLLLSPGDFPTSASVLVEAIADPEIRQQRPLPDLLRKGTFVDGICWLARQMAEALAFMHAQNVQHLDLKPSNVLVTPSGTSLLMDFNLSADAGSENHLVGGTLPYMSPEQLRAMDSPSWDRAIPLDGRSDVFSLGVMIYELLARQHPFVENVPHSQVAGFRDQLLTKQTAGARPLGELCPQLDARVARLFDRCLAFDPQNRPQTAAEVIEVLEEYLVSRQKMLEPQTTLPALSGKAFSQPSIQPRPRHRLLKIAMLSVCCLLGLGVAAWSFWPKNPAPVVHVPNVDRADHFQAAVAAFQAGDYQEAAELFSKRLKQNKEDVRALFGRGRCYQLMAETDNTNFSSAMPDFYQCRNLKPDQDIQSAIEACLGYCLQRTGQAGKNPNVEFHYEKALKNHFSTGELYNNLGYLQLLQKEYKKAAQNLENALAQNPELPMAFHNLAKVYARQIQDPKESAGMNSQQKDQILAKAQQAIAIALKKAEPSGELYQDAAVILALASKQDKSQQSQIFGYLQKSIEQGSPALPFLSQPAFQHLLEEPQFQKLTRQIPGQGGKKLARHILDPLGGQLFPF